MTLPKKWQDDEAFVSWLTVMSYVYFEDGRVKPLLSEAQTIYMWEAWQAGQLSGA